MHKIASFQFSCHAFFSFSTLLLLILCVFLFMLVLFRNRLFVAFVFCIFVIRSRLHTHCKTHMFIHNADLNAPHDMLMHACKSIEMKRRQWQQKEATTGVVNCVLIQMQWWRHSMHASTTITHWVYLFFSFGWVICSAQFLWQCILMCVSLCMCRFDGGNDTHLFNDWLKSNYVANRNSLQKCYSYSLN